MTMKRCRKVVGKGCTNQRGDSKKQPSVVPVLIEAEDGSRRNPIKRKRNDAAALNLLIRVIAEDQAKSQQVYDFTKGPSSPTTSNDTNRHRVPTNRIVNHIPQDDRSISIVSHEESVSLSPLPDGRPLMAPPRLPSQAVPAQVSFFATRLMPLETTLLPRNSEYTKHAIEWWWSTPCLSPILQDYCILSPSRLFEREG